MLQAPLKLKLIAGTVKGIVKSVTAFTVPDSPEQIEDGLHYVVAPVGNHHFAFVVKVSHKGQKYPFLLAPGTLEVELDYFADGEGQSTPTVTYEGPDVTALFEQVVLGK